jgi:hypothetical protein
MKKWMIIAVVAALFMVMFPACGGDDAGEDDRAASDVKAVLVGSDLLITWTGSAGVDYTVYYAEKKDTATRAAQEAVIGQRALKYELKDKAVVTRVNDREDYWSVYSDGVGEIATNLASVVGGLTGEFCFGVGPAYTGSYAIDENVPIVWDIGNIDSNQAAADGVAKKDWGYITFP